MLLASFITGVSTVISFFLPFVLLLIMNSVIIHTLRKRSKLTRSDTVHQGHGQGQNDGESPKSKTSETQIYVILLLITFGFLILTTPNYAMFLVRHPLWFSSNPLRLSRGIIYFIMYFDRHITQTTRSISTSMSFLVKNLGLTWVKLFKSTES